MALIYPPARLQSNIHRYSFARVADDLVDNAPDEITARAWIARLTSFLDVAYAASVSESTKSATLYTCVRTNFPASAHAALLLLPTHLLSCGPLYELLEGFKTDLEFPSSSSTMTKSKKTHARNRFPIETEEDLDLYAARVAGTIAELCLELTFRHSPTTIQPPLGESLVRAGGRMGIALQYVNMARDIATDASIGRVYIPTSWLAAEGTTPDEVLESGGRGVVVEKMRKRLLARAFAIHDGARGAIEKLPAEARAAMRVAVESYMEIGRCIAEEGVVVGGSGIGRATVPQWRRLVVAWRALSNG